jgi:Asp-tRNA(Asn)/Glu-tRNA(Gln) amidotransferase C subunit
MNEDVTPNLPTSVSAVLREDVPVRFSSVDLLLRNAPVVRENCPAVPLVMEDL